jgi:hypothetical protein
MRRRPPRIGHSKHFTFALFLKNAICVLRVKEAITEGFKFAGPDGKKFSKLQPAGKFFAVAFTGVQYLLLIVTLPVAFVWSVATGIFQYALFRVGERLGERNWLVFTIAALFSFAWPAFLLLNWKYGAISNAPEWLQWVTSPAAAAAGLRCGAMGPRKGR